MIKTILFDMGGVIITLDQPEARRRFEALGLSNAAAMLDAYTQQGLFGDVESGRITDEEFRQQLGELCGRELTWEQCQHAWLGYMGGVPQRNLIALEQLKSEGYRVVLLSNTNPFMMDYVLSARFDGHPDGLAHYLDAIYMSYKCGVMKPDETFFRKVLAAEKIIPDETLFLDDGPRNVAAASQLGIHTYLVDNGEDWTQHIYEYLEKR